MPSNILPLHGTGTPPVDGPTNVPNIVFVWSDKRPLNFANRTDESWLASSPTGRNNPGKNIVVTPSDPVIMLLGGSNGSTENAITNWSMKFAENATDGGNCEFISIICFNMVLASVTS